MVVAVNSRTVTRGNIRGRRFRMGQKGVRSSSNGTKTASGVSRIGRAAALTSWDDLGGRRPDVWEAVWDVPCPCCGAAEGEKCTNPISKISRHIPCVSRLQKAGRQ